MGRVAAIINWLEVNDQNQKKMRFGWFDMIDEDRKSRKAKKNKREKENLNFDDED